MELQIRDLVDSIKKEGVDVAKKEAADIVDQARKKAGDIINNAKTEAATLFEDCKKQVDTYKQSAEVSVQQAKRDAVLSFKTEIENQFKRILSQDVKKVLDSDALGKLIAGVLAGEDVSKFQIEVASVTDALKTQLADEIKNGLEIRPVKNIDAGFKLSAKDGSGYFDCTDEEIVQMLSPFFSDLSI